MTLADRLKKLANEIFLEWANDNDMRVGKMMRAMAGELPGYRADIDELLKDLERGNDGACNETN